ncbi:MAG: prolyl oligopeptidase family serine peptidase [Clostridiales bacterium]|nr:prolyl oligopeptidase family serine peptidase [Clostridiales bacterium]
MKKIISVILASIVVLMCVVSCSNNQNNETTVSTIESTSPVDTTNETTIETTTEETTTTEVTTQEETTTEEETTTAVNQNEKITENLVAGWVFDSIEDGYVKDVSGNGNDAKVSGNPSIVKGKDGGAINLASVGDHLYVENSDSLKFSKTDSFSVVVTAKWNGEKPESWPCIFNNGLNKSEKKFSYFGFWIKLTMPKMVFGITGEGKENYVISYLANSIDNNWHTYKIVQDGDSGNVFFYVDGIYQGVEEAFDVESDIGAFIGYDGSNGNTGQFLGQIDEILIYKDNSGLEPLDTMEYCSFTYKGQNTTLNMPYRVYYPSDYDTNSKKQYPILLFLHGYGECGTDNIQQVRVNDVDNELLERVIKKDNCIIIAPQCREESNYNWIGVNKQWYTGSRGSLPAKPTISLEAAKALLDQFLGSGKVDRTRIYISGLSMGGYGTWEMLARYPDLFAAAIPVCGAGFPSLGYTLVDVNIWAFHGTDDPTVPYSGTQDMYKSIVEAGGKLINMTLYQGVQHNSWIPAYSEGKLLDWLFSCVREVE